ncbi:unnamed protein product [Durusdinium trenchii]|uniref:Uncharacterized protein n=1 Tax=Durusdinium trenchii TaxID=1381693 RepID=A0ABP0NYD8_9DINO
MAPSTLAKVLWINLDRREDRAEAQLRRLEAAGLEDFSERFGAVDGAELDFATVPEDVLTAAGRHQAEHPPDFVLGRVLTPGAIGLWLSWYEVMCRIIEEASPDECFLVVEDDAEYMDGFGPAIFRLLEALDSYDASWHACAVGFIRSKSRSQELCWGDRPPRANETDHVLRAPTKLCGATAILVHGPSGAEEMLGNLFPVDFDQQFDLKITLTLHDPRSTLRFYCAATPLCTAPLSEAGDSDIQRIPPEKQLQLRHEAAERHQMGDLLSTRPSEQATNRRASTVLAPSRAAPSASPARGGCSAVQLEWCCLCQRPPLTAWPRGGARPRREHAGVAEHSGGLGDQSGQDTAGDSGKTHHELTEEELALQELRALDKGMPELRRLHGELAGKTQQLRSRPSNLKQVEKEHQALHLMLQEAVEVRDHILQAALPYRRRPTVGKTKKAILLQHVPNGDSSARATATFPSKKRRILIMGPYHSCTNAMAKELDRRFHVEILNDWHTCKADADWKHRAHHRAPPGLAPDVFCILMVKEPHFWLQSCSRELRNFFELRPVALRGTTRRELPAQELRQLLSNLEHDGILYENAMDLWNDTMQSYLDDHIYPPSQSVIVRCEDFLFSYAKVMDALQKLGALKPRSAADTEPLKERAKGHKECRTRDEALEFYRQPKNRKGAFTSDQLALINFALDASALAQLGYDQPDVVQNWSR